MRLTKTLILIFVLSFITFMPTCNALHDWAKSTAFRALEITADFERPIIGGNPEEAKRLYSEYKSVYDSLQEFLANPPQNTWQEDKDCVSYAGTIVALRRIVLMDYIIMVKAYQENRTTEYERMQTVLYNDWDSARYYRNQFRRKYGF